MRELVIEEHTVRGRTRGLGLHGDEVVFKQKPERTATKIVEKLARTTREAGQSRVLHRGVFVAENRRWRSARRRPRVFIVRTISREKRQTVSQGVEVQDRRQNVASQWRRRIAQNVRQGSETVADDPRDILVISRLLSADHDHETLPRRDRLARFQHRRLPSYLPYDLHQSRYLRCDELRVQERV